MFEILRMIVSVRHYVLVDGSYKGDNFGEVKACTKTVWSPLNRPDPSIAMVRMLRSMK